MGTFHTKCLIENHVDRKKSILIPKLLVDTGNEYTWIPEHLLEKIAVTREKKDLAFVMANGQQIIRSVGFAVIRLNACKLFSYRRLWTIKYWGRLRDEFCNYLLLMPPEPPYGLPQKYNSDKESYVFEPFF